MLNSAVAKERDKFILVTPEESGWFWWRTKLAADWLPHRCKCVCPSDGKDLYIGRAVQKAYLEVTEEGSEGAIGSGIRFD